MLNNSLGSRQSKPPKLGDSMTIVNQTALSDTASTSDTLRMSIASHRLRRAGGKYTADITVTVTVSAPDITQAIKLAGAVRDGLQGARTDLHERVREVTSPRLLAVWKVGSCRDSAVRLSRSVADPSTVIYQTFGRTALTPALASADVKAERRRARRQSRSK